jgi:hypothetical protein
MNFPILLLPNAGVGATLVNFLPIAAIISSSSLR